MDDQGDFLNQVLELYETGQWPKILLLNEHSNSEAARKICWIWPSESNLQFIKRVSEQFNLNGIISIGCGCGLFEYFLQSVGCNVIGYEVNEKWWKSKYSNPQFIELKFPDYPAFLTENDILRSDYALLFCYFNNGPAFRDYIDHYKGTVVIIIGPGLGSGRHTDPQPFTPSFGETQHQWILYASQEVKTTKDFIAIYTRTR